MLILAQDAIGSDNIFDFWSKAFPGGRTDHSPVALIARLVVAFLLGCTIAAVYRSTAIPTRRTRSFLSTLVLLCVLISLVTQVVGESVARAFSLVGSLSIVRFRTVVQDTRDTAFVIFAVVIGMAIGNGNLLLSLIGVVVCSLAAFMLNLLPAMSVARPNREGIWKLRIRLQSGENTEAVPEMLSRWFVNQNLVAGESPRKSNGLTFRYEVVAKSGVNVAECLASLRSLPGVQSVKLSRE